MLSGSSGHLQRPGWCLLSWAHNMNLSQMLPMQSLIRVQWIQQRLAKKQSEKRHNKDKSSGKRTNAGEVAPAIHPETSKSFVNLKRRGGSTMGVDVLNRCCAPPAHSRSSLINVPRPCVPKTLPIRSLFNLTMSIP